MNRQLNALISALAIAALVAIAAGPSATAHEAMKGTPTAVSTSTGAAFMVIENTGPAPDRLIGGTATIAETIEIHEVLEQDGVKKMRPLADGLEIPAGGTVVLKLGGYHIMLYGLTESLVEGMTYELVLTFAEAGEVVIAVPVYADATAAMAATPTAPVAVGTITISGAWSRPVPAVGSGGKQTAGSAAGAFMTIANGGSEADTLIAVRTEMAATAEIHEMKEGEGGVMKMSPLANGLEIPAGGSVALKPGGYHVMLFGLKQDFTPGLTYELTLTFAHAGDVTITMPVLTAAPEPDDATPVVAGAITISGQWSRPAPSMHGSGSHEATPATCT